MSKQSNRLPPALKHGAYSNITLLPGEDETEFKKLHDGLIAEFAPTGPLEEDIVETLASLLWRKANLGTYRLAKLARDRHAEIWAKTRSSSYFLKPLFEPGPEKRSPEEIHAAVEAAEKETRKELGGVLELVEIGNEATTDRLLDELSVVERLEGMVDRNIKRLLLVRGVKSMSFAPPVAPARSRKSRLATEDGKLPKMAAGKSKIRQG